MELPKSTRQGFVNKFASAFTCHSIYPKKDKKRPLMEGSSPESEFLRPEYKKDLLVHPKKIGEVEVWLTSILNKRSNPNLYLVLSGPSGCGKLTTLKTIARERGMDVIELEEVNYIKDIFSVDKESNYDYKDHLNNRSQIDNVRNFLVQANGISLINKKPKARRIVVIKELPSTLNKEPEKYHKLWTWYYNEFSCDGVPVVFIITIDPGRDPIKIFPSQLKANLNVLEIQFNPIAKTRIIKWLTDKLEKKISKQEIETIVEEGKSDIRNILNCLELKLSNSSVRQGSVSGSKRNSKKPRTESYSSKAFVSRAMGGRDLSLDLYHFLGKILFSKRDFDKPMRKTLPDSLRQFERHPLNEDPFLLSDSYELSPNTLILFLHQNYLHYSENLESAASSIEWLSQADCIKDDVYDYESPLEKYQSCLSIAGLMFDLSPNGPVKVKTLEDRRFRAENHDSRRSAISSNRAWHLAQEKIKESRSTLKRALNDKSTSLITQEFILNVLPYVSAMDCPRKQFPADLIKLACFPNISTGGFKGSQEPFNSRNSSIQSMKESSSLEMENQDESEDESHYIIEDDSS